MKVRSGYSFKAAYGKLPDVLSRLKEINYTVAPISDRLSTFAFRRWTEMVEKEGLRPIYGVELPCTPKLSVKKPPIDFWTFFAKDDIKDLHDIISICTEFHGKDALLDYRSALATPGLVKITGERVLLDSIPDGVEDLYISLSPSTSMGLYRRAVSRGFKFIASSDNYYPTVGDLETYRIAIGFRGGTQTYPRHILSDEEIKEWFSVAGFSEKDVQEAFDNRQKAMDQCQAKLRKAKLLTPKKPKTLRELCIEGAKERGIDLNDTKYSSRLERELSLIAEKEFEDYFFIVADLIAYAKRHMVVGPARGSSCGSLVCYLLHITEIDPLPYGLIFERFIDVNRKDMPDIDIDFSNDQRPIIFEYAQEKYGRARVARLGTVGLFKYKSALKQAGQLLGLSQWEYEKVYESVKNIPGDKDIVQEILKTDLGQKLLKDHPNMRMATLLEDHPTHSSKHAAGVVITDEPVTHYVAVNAKDGTSWCDKEDAEALGLLKLDALGLKQLAIFERTQELIGKKPISGFLETLPLDDPAAFAVLNKQKYSGIFQFDRTIQGLSKNIIVEDLNDIVALIALGRPGPLAFADTWIRRRNGKEQVSTAHPILDEILKETQGIILYQEQVMRICREMGNMTWEDTSAVRKGIGKKLGPQFLEKYWPQFVAGATANGVPESIARTIWDQIPAFGIYAFNKSHAVAYGVMSYWCCWLKAHYPVEFAAATLDSQADTQKQITILRELHDEGVGYLPVDPDYSSHRWNKAERDGRTILVGPLTAIKGIGAKTVREVLDSRSEGVELRASLKKLLTSAKTPIDSLWPIRDKIREIYPDLTVAKIISEPVEIRKVQPGSIRGNVLVLGVIKRLNVKDENDDASVTRRGGKRVSGPTKALNIFIQDDTDEIFVKIDRYKFENLGNRMLEKAKAGKSLYAISGTVPPSFRMISVENIRYLGEIDDT